MGKIRAQGVHQTGQQSFRFCPPSNLLGFVALRQCDVVLNIDVFNVQQGLSNILESLEKNLKNALWFIFVQQVMHNNKNVLDISHKRELE